MSVLLKDKFCCTSDNLPVLHPTLDATGSISIHLRDGDFGCWRHGHPFVEKACRLVAVKKVLPNALTADQIGTAVKKVLPYALTTDEIGTAVKKVLPNAPTADDIAKAVVKVQPAVPTEDAILERVSSAVNSIVKEVEKILPSVPTVRLCQLQSAHSEERPSI